MFRRIIQISSFFVVFSMVFALPASVLAQEINNIGSQPGNQGMMNQQQMQPQQFFNEGGQSSSGGFSSGPTCNVNGVEMPGSCNDRQQMFGPNMGNGPQGGMMGTPGGENGGMRFGPSEEEQQKMDTKREEMEKKQRQKGLDQMKKGIKQMVKQLQTIESRIVKIEKQGITVPAALKEKITTAKTTVETILAATDFDEVQDQMESMQEIGPGMGDTMRQLEILSRLPKMLKQAETEIVRLDKAYKSSATKAQRAKIDVSSVLEKWQIAITELKTTLANIKQGGVGDEEDPMQVIGDEIFGRMEETWRYQQTIDMILNAKRNLKQVATAIKRYDRTITSLKKKGEDTTEAESLLSEMKIKYGAVNQLVSSGGNIDPDEVEAVLGDVQDYMEMQAQIEELLNLSGPSMFEKGMRGPASSNEKMPQLNMPNFEKMMLETKNLKSLFAQDWAMEEAKLLVELQTEKTTKLKELAATLKDAKAKIIELTSAGVSLPDELKEGVLNTLAALGLPSTVAQR